MAEVQITESSPPMPPEVRHATTELIWRCSQCGFWQLRDQEMPPQCPQCGSPKEELYLVLED